MFFTNTYKRTFFGGLLLSLVLFFTFLPAVAPLAEAADTVANSRQTATDVVTSISNQIDRNVPTETDVVKNGCWEGFNQTTIAACAALGSYYTLKLTYEFTGLVSILFNIAFFKLVVGMGATVEQLSGITTAWTALRDIGNIFLVFLLVYVGISTILGLSGYGYKRILWKILIAALLVNFSITFTKLIIDVTNITAIEMYDTFIQSANYDGMKADDCLRGGGQKINDNASLKNNKCIDNGLAGVFWTKLRLTTIWEGRTVTTSGGTGTKADEEYWDMTWSALLATVLLLILAFIFGATAFFLVTRFVILLFLMIVSPIALIAAITGVSGAGRTWFRTLLNQSIFAPLILLTWWLAYLSLDNITGSNNPNASLGGGNISDPTILSITLSYVVVTGFLIAGLIVAKSLGAHGSNAAINIGQRWSKAAVYGTAGFVGVNTAGRLSSKVGDIHRRKTEAMFAKDENGDYINNSQAAHDFRNSKLARKLNRGVQNTLDAGSKKKFFGTKSLKERQEGSKKADEQQLKDINVANRKRELKDAVKEGRGDTLGKASVTEIENNAEDLQKNPSAARHISQSAYKKLRENKNNKFTEDDLRKFDAEREKHFNEMGSDEISTVISKSSPKDLAELNSTFLGRKEVIGKMDTQTLAGMHKSGLSKEKREAIKNTVDNEYNAILKKHADPDVDAGEMSQEERNIEKLYEWLNDDNKMAV